MSTKEKRVSIYKKLFEDECISLSDAQRSAAEDMWHRSYAGMTLKPGMTNGVTGHTGVLLQPDLGSGFAVESGGGIQCSLLNPGPQKEDSSRIFVGNCPYAD